MGIEIYTDNIISQHKDKPNFIAWLSAALNINQDVKNVNDDVYAALDLETAEGINLDILGAIVGVNRTLTFQPLDNSSPILDDATYRFLIIGKIEQNKWLGTMGELLTLWNNVTSYFQTIPLQIVDNQDMSMTITFLNTLQVTSLALELILYGYILPKPSGVRINYAFTTAVEMIGLTEHIYTRAITRHTILNVWHLGVDPFATVGSEVLIK